MQAASQLDNFAINLPQVLTTARVGVVDNEPTKDAAQQDWAKSIPTTESRSGGSGSFFPFNDGHGGTRCRDIYTNKIVIAEGHVSDFPDAHEHLQT